ncbi:drug/metabolite transporter (DMT)-like permease [Microbacterium halimionae]|uniref:Drug/metabolite transporter (DMT)-like permease n=1 Tax=Microbacterium halimionae TaxID=1526413 RepID=A0A7W3JPY7_9MICO|nr:hypothetical protein [Microbacterium halimionae]MBA8816753.1 drug/metabolite transporter (DMT)-like permease [Microbacterium halimionae]NII94951.1 drug/metabolite transporter (DMT)-like permease [Microbacterium halimionae]
MLAVESVLSTSSIFHRTRTTPVPSPAPMPSPPPRRHKSSRKPPRRPGTPWWAFLGLAMIAAGAAVLVYMALSQDTSTDALSAALMQLSL